MLYIFFIYEYWGNVMHEANLDAVANSYLLHCHGNQPPDPNSTYGMCSFSLLTHYSVAEITDMSISSIIYEPVLV